LVGSGEGYWLLGEGESFLEVDFEMVKEVVRSRDSRVIVVSVYYLTHHYL